MAFVCTIIASVSVILQTVAAAATAVVITANTLILNYMYPYIDIFIHFY